MSRKGAQPQQPNDTLDTYNVGTFMGLAGASERKLPELVWSRLHIALQSAYHHGIARSRRHILSIIIRHLFALRMLLDLRAVSKRPPSVVSWGPARVSGAALLGTATPSPPAMRAALSGALVASGRVRSQAASVRR
jgi:hypothetical protein